MWINVQKMYTPFKVYELFLEIIFLSCHVTPKRPVPGSNNPICPQDIFTKHWLISPCPCRGTGTPDSFMVRGSWLMISLGFKVILHLKQFRVVLIDHITRWINTIYKSQMKWTWHHLIEEVSFYHTQSGTPSTIIYTRWSKRHEGLGCHAHVVYTFRNSLYEQGFLLNSSDFIWIVLYCIVFYCIVLHCIALCFVLCCTILYRIYCIVLHGTVLCCVVV